MKFLLLIFPIMSLFCFTEAPLPEVYKELSDFYNPTLDDLRKVQAYVNEEKPILKRLDDTEFVPRQFKMIGDRENELPEFGNLVLRTRLENKENCIIVYSSLNRSYPKGVQRLLNALKNSDFSGHVYYRIGGWPNTEEGDFALAHVPYAFKVCFFREMRRLGYKRVLWLDASIIPFRSVNQVFGMIQQKGYFVQNNSHSVGVFMNDQAAASFGLTVEETLKIPSCSSAIFGIDFSNPRTAPIIDAWYEAAKDPCAYYSPRPEQSALSILLYRMGLTDWESEKTLGSPVNINQNILFIMDRNYVKRDR